MEFATLVAHGVAVIGNIGHGYELEHIVKGAFGESSGTSTGGGPGPGAGLKRRASSALFGSGVSDKRGAAGAD